MKLHKVFLLSAASLTLVLLSTPMLNAQNVRTVRLSGDSAGTGGEVFDSFGTPVLNNNGEVAFSSFLSGGGVSFSNDNSLWSEGGGSGLNVVAREGSNAPGTGAVFGEVDGGLVINDSGHTAFVSFLGGSGVNFDNDSAIWSEGQGNGLALVAREGDAAPGLGSGTNFFDFGNMSVSLNNQGNAAIRAFLTGGTNSDSVWTQNSAGGLDLVARAGDTAPGTGVPWTDFNFSTPTFNDNGQVAFDGGVFVTSIQQFGVWKGTAGNLTTTALPNGQAPGVPSGVVFDGAFSPVINGSGQTAFFSLVTGTGVNASNNSGIWSEGSGNGVQLIAREGNAAPDVAAGVVFSSFDSPVINDAGDVAFRASLTGTGVTSANDHGIWKAPGSSDLDLVVRDGDAAAGTGSGVVFDLDFRTANSVSMNSQGQVAFLALLTGSGVSTANDQGIWAEDLDGNLQLIAREGDLLEVFDDQMNSSFKTISGLSFSDVTLNSGNGDGRSSSFNDLGQLAFFARFTDGTEGIFVSNLVAVPEPGSALMAFALAIGFVSRRRRVSARD